jgi:hypothetical protein
MSKESTEAALGKFAEAVNTGKFDLFEQVVAFNCADHDPADGQVPGPAGYRMFFSGMRTAFPDLSVAPRDHRARRGHHRLRLHPYRHAHRSPRKDPAHRHEGQNPRNADLKIQRRQDGRALGKLRRVRPPKANRRHDRIGLNSVLLRRGCIRQPLLVLKEVIQDQIFGN